MKLIWEATEESVIAMYSQRQRFSLQISLRTARFRLVDRILRNFFRSINPRGLPGKCAFFPLPFARTPAVDAIEVSVPPGKLCSECFFEQFIRLLFASR